MPTPPDFTAATSLAAATLQKVGLWRVTSGTFTGITTGAPLDVSSVFTSDYTNYLLHLRASATVANANVVVRMRTNAGQDAGNVYNYSWGGNFVAAGPVYTWGSYAGTNPFAPETSMFSGMLIGNGYSGTTRLEFFSPNLARATRMNGQSYVDYTGTHYNVTLTAAGEVSNTTIYTGFRIFPIAGTIAGEYALYGYND